MLLNFLFDELMLIYFKKNLMVYFQNIYLVGNNKLFPKKSNEHFLLISNPVPNNHNSNYSLLAKFYSLRNNYYIQYLFKTSQLP